MILILFFLRTANDPSRASESALLFLFFGLEHLIPVSVYLCVAFAVRRGKRGFFQTAWVHFKAELRQASKAKGAFRKIRKIVWNRSTIVLYCIVYQWYFMVSVGKLYVLPLSICIRFRLVVIYDVMLCYVLMFCLAHHVCAKRAFCWNDYDLFRLPIRFDVFVSYTLYVLDVLLFFFRMRMTMATLCGFLCCVVTGMGVEQHTTLPASLWFRSYSLEINQLTDLLWTFV